MCNYKVLKVDKSYTFADYFKLKFAPADILADLGCGLERTKLGLISYQGELPTLLDLRERIEAILPHVTLTSEMARRELLIAPVVIELIRMTEADLNVEYAIEVNSYLKGELDYYLHRNQNLLIIEAKQADITRGFTQLAVELIALFQWLDRGDENITPLVGAVSTGDIWQFGRYLPAQQLVQQDLGLLRVPEDLEILMRILVNLL
ncbi:MAG: hypothetical protein GDA44_14490 [Prochloron sp. SP5CPC1]|nr:hypothetical protein [Candidatus Paraprochloron terpiosi SP5CPC1]